FQRRPIHSASVGDGDPLRGSGDSRALPPGIRGPHSPAVRGAIPHSRRGVRRVVVPQHGPRHRNFGLDRPRAPGRVPAPVGERLGEHAAIPFLFGTTVIAAGAVRALWRFAVWTLAVSGTGGSMTGAALRHADDDWRR